MDTKDPPQLPAGEQHPPPEQPNPDMHAAEHGIIDGAQPVANAPDADAAAAPPPPPPEYAPIDDQLLQGIGRVAYPLSIPPGNADYGRILAAMGDAEAVLLGENTHGTREFYQIRRELTQRLILEKGVAAVVIEADWPATQRLDRYIAPQHDAVYGDRSAKEALAGAFQHFPQWMWRNDEMEQLVEWLKAYNKSLSDTQDRVRLYGMDCYSLYESAHRVVAFLDMVDPEAAEVARVRYAVFEPYGHDSHAYGRAAGRGHLMARAARIQDDVAKQVAEMQWRRDDYVMQYCMLGDPDMAIEAVIDAEMNAEVVVMAEEYYRKLYSDEGGHVTTWNTRDQHMTATMLRILEHLRDSSRTGNAAPRVVVWAHNSHVADALATSMARYEEWNLGQMMRQTLGPERCFVLAFSTYSGRVTAAPEWDLPGVVYDLNPGLDRSHETAMHLALAAMDGPDGPPPAMLLLFRDPADPDRAKEAREVLSQVRLHRAVGVVYKAQTELQAHYCDVALPAWADGIVFVDVSNPVVECA